MEPLHCDFCNGALVIDDSREFAVCEYCGTKYLRNTIQQKIQEITGTVSVKGVVQTKESEFFIRGGVLIKYNGESTNVQIPDSVFTIGAESFRGLAIHSVQIPNSVTKIGREAFAETNLISVVIPDSVTEIADGAFYNCKYLREVTFPKIPFKEIYTAGYRHEIFDDCIQLETIINTQQYPERLERWLRCTPWGEKRSQQRQAWMKKKLCSYCGGQLTGSVLKGWNSKKCCKCNRTVDYDAYGNWLPK